MVGRPREYECERLLLRTGNGTRCKPVLRHADWNVATGGVGRNGASWADAPEVAATCSPATDIGDTSWPRRSSVKPRVPETEGAEHARTIRRRNFRSVPGDRILPDLSEENSS
jgi:hypothetical protein